MGCSEIESNTRDGTTGKGFVSQARRNIAEEKNQRQCAAEQSGRQSSRTHDWRIYANTNRRKVNQPFPCVIPANRSGGRDLTVCAREG